MLTIDHLEFSSPFVLAPLAGYTDLPFRLLCRQFGAGFTVSEMISCHGLMYMQSNTLRMLKSVDSERPVSFQLFGAEAGVMAEAAEILASFKPDMIDINMGCPVKKVTKRGAGAALMTTPGLAKEILTQVIQRVNIPVTVKFRSGKDSKNINSVEFAKMAEDSGVSAITVHARTWAQGFSGSVDQSVIADVKRNVSVPVIGNGDIDSVASGRRVMETTGCDGVMIGRAALGNPWVFQEKGKPLDHHEIMNGAKLHLDLMTEHLPADRVMGYVKNHISRYFKGLKGASNFRRKIFAAPNPEAIRQLLESYDLFP